MVWKSSRGSPLYSSCARLSDRLFDWYPTGYLTGQIMVKVVTVKLGPSAQGPPLYSSCAGLSDRLFDRSNNGQSCNGQTLDRVHKAARARWRGRGPWRGPGAAPRRAAPTGDLTGQMVWSNLTGQTVMMARARALVRARSRSAKSRTDGW